MPRKNGSNWQKDALIGLIITLGLCIGAEVGLRINEALWRNEPLLDLDRWEITDPDMGWKPRPDYSGEGIEINSKGFRGPEFSIEKSEGVFRIVTMGDSCTFGVVGTGAAYPAKLQNLLNTSGAYDCPLTYEVINAGVEGYSTWNVLQRLRKEVLPLKPDLVMVYVGWNDLYAFDPENPSNPARKESFFNQLLSHSYVLRVMARLVYWEVKPILERTTQEREIIYQEFIPVEFIENYHQIIRTCQDNDVEVVILTMPSLLGAEDWEDKTDTLHFPHFTSDPKLLTLLWRKYNRIIRQIAAEENVPLIDLAKEMEALSGESEYFFDTLHYYEDGHEKVAEIISGQLRKADLLCE